MQEAAVQLLVVFGKGTVTLVAIMRTY